MAKTDLYTVKGMKSGSFALPRVFSEKENQELLSQAVRVYTDGQHLGLDKKKTRAEVSISKRKIYRQKGTGRARHGAKSAPIFVGGGVTHGPRGVKRRLEIPRNMRQKALSLALSHKVSSGEILVVSGMGGIKKTKEVSTLLSKITNGKRALVVLSEKNKGTKIYFKNIKDAKVYLYKDLNSRAVLFGGVVVLDKDIFEAKKKVSK